MAINEKDIEAPIQSVWDVLADADAYGDWVVGAKEIRGTSGVWPEAGSALHHTLGAGPAEVVKDKTVVVESTPPSYLHLDAHMRPFGRAEIILELSPNLGYTRVVMRERFTGGLLGRVYGKVMSASIKARNVESLRRLGELAKERTPTA